VSGDTVTYTDCNYDGTCVIRWGQTISKSTLRSSFSYIRSAPSAAPVGSPAPAPAPEAEPAAEVIADDAAPMASAAAWSLADLLLALGTVALSAGMLAASIRRKGEDEDEDGDVRMHRGLRLASIIPAVAALALFILTQNLSSTMVIFDGLTAIFAGIALVNAAAAFISRKQVKDSRDAELIAIAAPAE
ncbi:MAG: hypothetical protein IKD70_04755, partial [Eggerthellaceae bacterium]|nr:hypothetical protein [Eggerthellaceae bacterium]